MIEVNTVGSRKVYAIEYTEHPLKVPETLPVANKMIGSFHVGAK
jgi:hypothetical protein